MRSPWHLFVFFILAVTVATVGCGDSDDPNVVNIGTTSTTGTMQIQFDRNNVLAQGSVQAGFGAADTYAVSILDANNRLVVPSTFQAADPTTSLQTIIVTNVPIGYYTVVLTSFLNGTPNGQVFVAGVHVTGGGVTRIGTGTPLSFEIYNGDFVPTPPGGTTTTGTTGGGTGTGTATNGGTVTTGTSGGSSGTSGTNSTGTSGGSSGTTGTNSTGTTGR